MRDIQITPKAFGQLRYWAEENPKIWVSWGINGFCGFSWVLIPLSINDEMA